MVILKVMEMVFSIMNTRLHHHRSGNGFGDGNGFGLGDGYGYGKGF